MFSRAKSGWELIGSAIEAFLNYPQLIVPLLINWVLYAGITLYFYFAFDWKAVSQSFGLAICFGIIFVFSFLLCFSACWLLELVEQIETGREPSLIDALNEVISANLIHMLPIAFLWAVIWFVLVLIDVLTREKNDKQNEDRKLNFENATRLLSIDAEASWTSLSIDMLQKLVRMLTFFSLPAICWQGMGSFEAIGESLRTAKKHVAEFLSGYALSGAMAFLVFFPAAFPIYLHDQEIIHLPDGTWPGLMIYLAFAWSFSIYVEQMFTAELYLWHLNWERAVQEAKIKGTFEPTLREVKRPSLIDGIADFKTARGRQHAQLDEERYSIRQTNELLKRIEGPVEFSCAKCNHKFRFKSAKELRLYDYDLAPENGIQVKCPVCSSLVSFS